MEETNYLVVSFKENRVHSHWVIPAGEPDSGFQGGIVVQCLVPGVPLGDTKGGWMLFPDFLFRKQLSWRPPVCPAAEMGVEV